MTRGRNYSGVILVGMLALISAPISMIAVALWLLAVVVRVVRRWIL